MVEEYVGAEEAARILGVKPATLYAYVSRGLVRSYRRGLKRARLYRRSELEELVRLRPSDEGPLDRVPMAADWMPYV
ncbi:MAG TPA: helix-turn-helix domain-containing protein [Chloroflexota bacterium]|jgi:citrate synthase|nr:helix-turn-helix domain-containing protein [Chloroflexota bacterium]